MTTLYLTKIENKSEKSDLNGQNKSAECLISIPVCINCERALRWLCSLVMEKQKLYLHLSLSPWCSQWAAAFAPPRLRRAHSEAYRQPEPPSEPRSTFGYTTATLSGFILALRKQFPSHEQQASIEANVTGKRRTEPGSKRRATNRGGRSAHTVRFKLLTKDLVYASVLEREI